MEPTRFDGPSIDRSVLRRLHRLDRNLRVTFSPWALDTLSGRPIEMDAWDTTTGEGQVGLCHDPAFYLWRKDDASSHHFFVTSYTVQHGFTHRDVLRLEADLARFHSPKECWRIVKANYDRRREAETRAHRGLMLDKAINNRKLMLDAMQGNVDLRRAPKVFGYSGQAYRRSSAESAGVARSNRELGIEE
jgi:hypothetical protein